jgi:hypothetical protein
MEPMEAMKLTYEPPQNIARRLLKNPGRCFDRLSMSGTPP